MFIYMTGHALLWSYLLCLFMLWSVEPSNVIALCCDYGWLIRALSLLCVVIVDGLSRAEAKHSEVRSQFKFVLWFWLVEPKVVIALCCDCTWFDLSWRWALWGSFVIYFFTGFCFSPWHQRNFYWFHSSLATFSASLCSLLI